MARAHFPQVRRFRQYISAVVAVALLVSLLMPQTMYFYRPVIVFALFSIWMAWNLGPDLYRSIRICRVPLLLLGLFGCVVAFRHFAARQESPISNIYGASLFYCAIMVVVATHHRASSTASLQQIRIWAAIVVGLATIWSIPVLYANPWGPRFLSTGVTAIVDESMYLRGIGNYFHYTSLAVISPCLVLSLFRKGVVTRVLLIIALAAMAVSVVLAMFTMATLALYAGVAIALLYVPFLLTSRRQVLIAVVTLSCLAVGVASIQFLYDEFETFRFVQDKFLRIASQISEEGFVDGDDTGRGQMFVATWHAFLASPLVGTLDDSSIGGHSSAIDPWALFGVLGYLPFFGFQVYSTVLVIRTWRRRRKDPQAVGSVISWTMYWIATILNPMWSVLPVLVFFTDCVPTAGAESAALGRVPLHRRVQVGWKA